MAFFLVLERDLGVNHQHVLEASRSLLKVQVEVCLLNFRKGCGSE